MNPPLRDTYRQATIDLIIGQGLSEEVFKTEGGDLDDIDGASSSIHVKSVIEDCKKLLTQDSDQIIGVWGLIDADMITGDPAQEDLDIVFILTSTFYFVARYDDQLDKIVNYQQVALCDVVKVEFGLPDQSFNLPFINKTDVHCFRLQYMVGQEPGYHHMFRSTSLRFFNNVATEIKSEEEKVESLKAIADSVAVAMEAAGITPDVWFGKLEKRRSKQAETVSTLNPVEMLNLQSGRGRSPAKLRNVGSKALSNVTSTFSKLNPISRLRKPKDFTDIRTESEFTDGSEVSRENSFSSPLHLPSSGLLIPSAEDGQVSVCMETNSISYRRSEEKCQPPSINVTHQESEVPHSQGRARKISKSSTDLRCAEQTQKSHPNQTMEDVFVSNPLNKLARSLHSLGSNIDVALQSESVGVQIDPNVHQGAGIGERQTRAATPNPTPFSAEVQEKIEASSCRSLILTI